MFRTRIIFAILLTAPRIQCQSVEKAIRTTAIEYKAWTSPNQEVYSVLKNYKVICLGEMHGTKEPAEFLTGLARTFISNNRRIIVCLEIADSLMTQFAEQRDPTGLSRTNFFSGNRGDGRNSAAWFSVINACNNLGVRFCFFDNSDDNRDLGMYQRIMDCYSGDTTSVVLVLSGNIHNKIVPYKNDSTMGCYLKAHFGRKLCSINHLYNGGTMYNNTSEGLKVHQVQPLNSVFSTATDYDGYYLPNIFTLDDYTGFFFTRTITASLPAKKPAKSSGEKQK